MGCYLVFDGGIFVIFLGLALLFLLVSFKIGAVFALLSAILFFSLAIILIGQSDVGFESNIETALINGTSLYTFTTNSTVYVIGDGNSGTDDNQNILAWLFFAMAILAVAMFFMEMIGMGEIKKEGRN